MMVAAIVMDIDKVGLLRPDTPGGIVCLSTDFLSGTDVIRCALHSIRGG